MHKKNNVWTVEGRWENTRESVAEASYFEIEKIGGDLAAAQRIAQEYLYRRVSRASSSLGWTVGTNGQKAAYYAATPAITFRITG